MGANGGSEPTLPIKMEVVWSLKELETRKVVRQVVADEVKTDLPFFDGSGFATLVLL